MKFCKLLVSMAVALFAVSVLAYFGGFAWWLDLPAHFRPHMVIAGTGLGALLVLLGQRRFAVLCVGIIVLAGAPLLRDIPFETAPAGEPDLRILSWNVFYRSSDPEAGVAMLKARNADILILAETDPGWRRHMKALDELYPYQMHDDTCDDVGCQVSLLSKRPWRSVKSQKFFGHTPPVIWAAFDGIDGGPPFHIVAVHIRKAVSADGAMRQRKQVAALGKMIRSLEGEVIMAGDMNAAPSSAAFRRLAAATGLRNRQTGLRATWPMEIGPLGISIDHFFTRGPLGISVERLGSFSSDHMALEAGIFFR